MFKLFKKKSKKTAFRSPARYYYPSSGWGNSIVVEYVNDEHGMSTVAKVHGWQSPRPSEGDVFIQPMSSGNDTVWVFGEMRYPNDPADMFFGELTYVGYVDSLEMPEKIERSMFL